MKIDLTLDEPMRSSFFLRPRDVFFTFDRVPTFSFLRDIRNEALAIARLDSNSCTSFLIHTDMAHFVQP
jgi:hypothetical protein